MQLGLSVEFGFGSCWMRVSFSVFYILEPKVCGLARVGLGRISEWGGGSKCVACLPLLRASPHDNSLLVL